MAEKTKEEVAQQENAVAVVDFTKLPDLSKAEPESLELSGEYWTPENPGESKRVFFVDIALETVLEPGTGEQRELPVVRFAENVNGTIRGIRNGSSRLVGVFQQFQASIRPGDAFEITYLGKKRNKTNAFTSDNWKVTRLILK